MTRARPNLERAINDLLIKHGTDGRKMSLRQAERLTGLSPATIGELAKGNARTAETVRRFAAGMGADTDGLLLMAGFVPQDSEPAALPLSGLPDVTDALPAPDVRAMLERYGRALSQLPPGHEQHLWREHLRHSTELIEAFLKKHEPK